MRTVIVQAFVLILLLSCSKDKEAVNSPVASTNDNFILYSTNKNGHNELYRYDFVEETLLLSDPDYDYWWPKVSPDKSRFLVYRSAVNPEKDHDNYQEAELLLVDIDGKNPQVLIEKGKHGWFGQGVCRWNKAGTKILMIAEQETAVGKQWRMVITDALGNNPKNLSDWWIIDPNFSIDNSQVVYMAFPDNVLSFDLSKLELHSADYDSINGSISNMVRLTTNATRDHDPSFSPSGKQIVYSAGNVEYTNVDITVYDTESKEENKVVDDSGTNGGSMCWSSDGIEIYFHGFNLTQHPFQIKRVNTVTKEVTTVLSASSGDFGYFHPESY